MSRDLETRLALASFKHKYNMHNLAFDHVEAQVNDTRSKRSLDDAPSVVSTECSSSSSSGDSIDILPAPLSSPLAKALRFSDAGHRRHPASGGRARKKARFEPQYLQSPPASSAQKPGRRAKRTPNQSWRTAARAPRHVPSSPLPPAPHRRAGTTGLSFALSAHALGGGGSPPPSSPPPTATSDAHDPPLPTLYHGSPPRTPPPSSQHPGLRKRKAGAGAGEEGADLLLYLATSPTPATPRLRHAAGPGKGPLLLPPSTPPSRTAGAAGAAAAPAASPLAPFNFADYLNVTPSPAQAPFGGGGTGTGRTPGGATRTPLAAKEARRRLNFDNLVPPGGRSPGIARTGLGMELGGELTS